MAKALSENAIRNAVTRLVAAAHAPCKVILFGSYGRAEAQETSDLDLLVVEREINDYTAEYSRLREAVGSVGVGVDLILCTAAEFEKRRHWWTTPIYWADKEGRVLYERS